MRILILGSSGLIGHTLLRELSKQFDTYGTLHKIRSSYKTDYFENYNIIDNLDVNNIDLLKGVLISLKPDVVLNCVGITRRKITPNNVIETIKTNAVFPHILAQLSEEFLFRIIHFSTDCVFDGKIGNYNEEDITTAEDLYGRTKAMGELSNYNKCLTIRSSFIGQELFDKTELLDWFLKQEGNTINGYKNTFYSGVSTIFMSKVVINIIINHNELHGLFNLATKYPISKFDLLNIAKKYFNIDVKIKEDNEHIHNPTLNSIKLRSILNLYVPNWDQMMGELAEYKY